MRTKSLHLSFFTVLALLACISAASAATNTFKTGTSWNVPTDWSSGATPSPSDAIRFSQTFYGGQNSNAAIPNTTLGNSFTIQSLSFDSGADSFSIDANPGGSTTAQTLTFNTTAPANAVGGYDSIGLGSGTTGTITLGGTADRGLLTLAFGSNPATVGVANAAANLVLGPYSAISGSAGLNKSGLGTLTLGGVNTYTGDTNVRGGTLAITGTINTPGKNLVVDGSSADAPAATLSGSNAQFTLANATIGNASGNTGSFLQSGGSTSLSSNIILGNGTGSNGSYTLSGGSLSGSGAYVGLNGTGNFVQTGGSYTASGGIIFGFGAAASGAYNLSAGSLSAYDTYIGYGGMGRFTQSGGVYTLTTNLSIATLSGSTGSYTLSAGSVSIPSTLRIGGTGTGSFTQTGGTASVGSSLVIGSEAGGSGTYDLSGGTLSESIAYVGYNGTGSLIHNGGTNTVTSDLILGNGAGSSGTYTLSSSGILQTPSITRGSGAGMFNFNGGTLKPNQSKTNFMQGLTASNVQGGGAVIDTNSFNITITQPLLHDSNLGSARDGGLTKTGSGILTLSGANTFTGKTTVSGGTLKLNASAGTNTLSSMGGSGSGAEAATQAANSDIQVSSTGSILQLGASNQINDAAKMGLSGGKFDTQGFSEGNRTTPGVGSLTLSANSIIDLGGATNTVLHFASSNGQIWSGTLEIWNWSGSKTGNGTDQLLFGFDNSSLTPSQLGQIRFYSDSGASYLGFGGFSTANVGEIVPVPEPTTMFAAAGLLGMVGWRERRRLKRLWPVLPWELPFTRT